MTHIKLVSSGGESINPLLATTHTQRIIDWNRKRNGLKFDIDLETQMLSEEANEFYMAETLVDRFDAWADFIFVGVGTVTKYLATKHKYYVDQKETQEQVDALTAWMEHNRMQMVELLSEEILAINPKYGQDDGEMFDELCKKVQDIVIEANEAKGTTLDCKGKVTKHADFVKPELQIDNLLRKELGKKYVSSYA